MHAADGRPHGPQSVKRSEVMATLVERLTSSLAKKQAKARATADRSARRVKAAESSVEKARVSLEKAQARLRAAETKLEQVRASAEELLVKQTADAEATASKLAEAEERARSIPVPSAARVTTAPARRKEWVVLYDGGEVAVQPGIRASLNAFLGRKKRVTLDNEFSGRLLDVLGIEQCETLRLTIPGRNGYTATVTDDGLEFVRG
jgi:hypothetical protein